jgi:hypothetical protein
VKKSKCIILSCFQVAVLLLTPSPLTPVHSSTFPPDLFGNSIANRPTIKNFCIKREKIYTDADVLMQLIESQAASTCASQKLDKKTLSILHELGRCYATLPNADDHPNWAFNYTTNRGRKEDFCNIDSHIKKTLSSKCIAFGVNARAQITIEKEKKYCQNLFKVKL